MTQLLGSSATTDTSRRTVSTFAPAIIAALVAAALYACTLSGTYVYDDIQVIQLDPRVAQPASWRYFWTRD